MESTKAALSSNSSYINKKGELGHPYHFNAQNIKMWLRVWWKGDTGFDQSFFRNSWTTSDLSLWLISKQNKKSSYPEPDTNLSPVFNPSPSLNKGDSTWIYYNWPSGTEGTILLFSRWSSHIVIQRPIKMASVSTGALHSCEDHLQEPRSVSAARLESLAFIQAQNGNGSEFSVSHLFLFSSSLSLGSDSSPVSATGHYSHGFSAHLACFFPAYALSGEPVRVSVSRCCLLSAAPRFAFKHEK